MIKVYNYKSRIVLFLIYMPTAASTWGLLGDLAAGMCVDSLCDGPVGILLLILIIIVISMLIIIIHYYSFYLTNIFNCSIRLSLALINILPSHRNTYKSAFIQPSFAGQARRGVLVPHPPHHRLPHPHEPAQSDVRRDLEHTIE